MPPKGWKKKKEEGEQLKLQQEQEGKSKDEKEPKAKDAKEHKSKEGKEGKVKEPKEPKAKDGKKEGKEAKSKDAKAPKDPKDAASTEAAASAPAKEEKEKKDKKDKDRRGSRSASRSRSRSRRRDRKESRSASPPPKKKKDKDRKKDKEKDKKEKNKEKDRDREKEDKGSRHRSPDAAASRSRSGSRARRKDRSAEPARPEGDDAAAGAQVPDWLTDLVQTPAAPAAGAVPRPQRREVMVPQQFVARLIGRGGETIMGICNATGADVKIRQETKEMGYSLAVITGPPDAMEKADIMVRQKLGLSSTGVATKEVPIPAEIVGSIIGPNGATLAEIRAMAGGMPVEVRPPDIAGMPHRAILGPGQQEQLLIVEHLLTGKMAEAAMQRLPL
uniref:K Homology domain-containing protein n=1 Tax=Alexandrium catenella TaxID=2925 RepID=A0A7S1S5D4_ALECA|mmetsp:Transcript_87006/g.231222  ORF Transcript_87006/g.231222 Transcript_87006/m.231222 type:complete len:388 (+) Transcript_87006:192-1355(+)